MFRAPSLLSYLLLALSVTGSLGSPAASAQPRIVSLPVKAPVSIAEMVKRDAARRTAGSADSEDSLHKRQSPTITDLANHLTGYSVGVGIGSPAYEYDLLLDTAHPNTWVGADQQFTTTHTTVNQGAHETTTYTQGSYTGYEVTDTVTLSTADVVTGQRVDVALASSGFEGFDGVLGLGLGSSALPTVLDNLHSQGKISTREFGLGLPPSYSASAVQASQGVLTFGGVDSSQYTGTLDYTTRLVGSPDTYWGVSTSISYGGTQLAAAVATTIDSLSPYILLPTAAYNSYVSSTGATLDAATGLLAISIAPPVSVTDIEITWGTGGTYSIPSDAQIWPVWANANIGGDGYHYYLLIKDGGSTATFGLPFMQRYYFAFDAATSRFGIATTSYTHATVSYPPVYDQPGSWCNFFDDNNCPQEYWCDIVDLSLSLGTCVILPTVPPNEQCYDGLNYDGPCGSGYTCQEISSDYWICKPAP